MNLIELLIVFIIFLLCLIRLVPIYVRILGKAFASGCLDCLDSTFIDCSDILFKDKKEKENENG